MTSKSGTGTKAKERIDVLLVELGLESTRSRAAARILAGIPGPAAGSPGSIAAAWGHGGAVAFSAVATIADGAVAGSTLQPDR
jgi:hypothetical protein